MKIQVMRPVMVNFKYFDVHFGGCFYPEDLQMTGPNGEEFCPEEFEEIEEKFPDLVDGGEFYLKINVDTGEILNWPAGWSADFCNVKLVDEGTYDLYDEDENLVGGYCGYVPDILQIEDEGYDDYTEFIVENGVINNWDCTPELINDILKEE